MPKTVNLTWKNTSSGITEQLVERSVTDGAFVQIGTTPPDQNSFTDNVDEFVGETKLSYKVSSKYNREGTAYSASSSIFDIVINQNTIPTSTPFEATIFNIDYPNFAYSFRGGYGWHSGENPTLIVDWGDGSPIETITDGNSFRHDYATPQQTHRIKLWLGNTRLEELYCYDTQIVHTFGDGEINAFIFESEYLTQVPEQLPSYVTVTYLMFKNAQLFNQDISMWDTSNVVNMSFMFINCGAFNQPLGSWNVSKVTDMSYMFNGASAFNQNLSQWCVLDVGRQGFNSGSALTVENLPVWGTCPRGENLV